MALLKYFKCIKPSKEERIQNVLPKPDGPRGVGSNFGLVRQLSGDLSG